MKNLKSWASLTGLAVLTAALAISCGGKSKRAAAFSTDWENDRGKSIRAVYEQVHNVTLPTGAALALGVTKSGLVARSLDNKESWSYKHSLDSRPVIATDVVIGSGSGNIFCLDAHTGKEIWQVPNSGLNLRGAGDDGKFTAVSLGAPDVTQNRFLVVGRQGNVVLDVAPAAPIGTPAVLGGIAFVPWGGQYVSAIDIQNGDEAGRLLSRSQVSHAVNISGQLYFAERGMVRFDEKIAEASRDPAQFIDLPQRELPGNPQWLLPGTRVTPTAAAALDKVRFYAAPNAQGNGVDGNRFAATYFRLAMGFDADAAKLQWVHQSQHDFLGAAAMSGGFAFCDATGTVSLIAASGDEAGGFSLGSPLIACVMQAGNFKVSPRTRAAPLFEQLALAVTLDDPQLVTAQRFLLTELGKFEDPQVTQLLIKIASHPRTPPVLLEEARRLLAARRNGAQYMLEALARHYDFLSGVLTAPPVGPLADALAAMGESRAAPLLAEHLNDPADSADDIARAARALGKLATASEYDALRTFFTLYRAAANDPQLIEAVIIVARAMLEVGGEPGREAVVFASNNPMTLKRVREGIEPMLQD